MLLASAGYASAQGIGIGTTASDASAALDVVASGKGALLPRLTQAARQAMGSGQTPAPAPGLIVYQTDGSQPGFWYNGGTAPAPYWVRLADSDGVSFDPVAGLTVGLNGIGHVQVGTQTVANTSISPYYSTNGGDQRTQYLFRAAALTAAGLEAGAIRSVSFTVTTKSSTGPYQGFTLKLGNTLNNSASTTFLTAGVTAVYSAAVTTVAGLNTYPCTVPFAWDGTSNLYLEVCFNNAVAVGTDAIAGQPVSYAGLGEYFNVPVGCTATSGASFSSNFLPIVVFGQAAPYTLPAAQGQLGQVLTQQAGGVVSFADPQWLQDGTNLTPSVAGSRVGLNTGTPVSLLANTPTNVGGSDGYGIGGTSLTWTHGAAGYTGAFYNSDNTAGGRNGLAVKVANATANTTALDISQGTSQTTPGTSLLRVRGDGNVGIGTASPTGRLDVNGSIKMSGGNANELNRTQTSSANLLPICYGNINRNGSINFSTSTNNFVVAHVAQSNSYRISIIDETYSETSYLTFVTGSNSNGFADCNSYGSSTGDLVVGLSHEHAFSFIVYKP